VQLAEKQVILRQVLIIVNPVSGIERPILRTLNDAVRKHGIEATFRVTGGAGDARRFAADAVRWGMDAVVVYGGDGTISEAAHSLSGTDIPLAILPGGSGNLLCKELGIPLIPARALDLLSPDHGVARAVDMGDANGNAFLVAVAAGAFADMIQRTDHETKSRIGWLAYSIGGIQAALEASPSHYRLSLDGEEVESEGVTCLVANILNVGFPGLTMAPTIVPDDGLLDVVVVRRVDLANVLAVAQSYAAPAGGIVEPLQHWRARSVTVESDPVQPATFDGEILPPGKITITVRSKAVQIIVPRHRGRAGAAPNPGAS
jgi:YegS/Rv2252/BmrU family lipid kinase